MADHGVLVKDRPIADLLPDFVAHLVNLSWLDDLDRPRILEEFDIPTRDDLSHRPVPAHFRRVVFCPSQWPPPSVKPRVLPIIQNAVSTLSEVIGRAAETRDLTRVFLGGFRLDELATVQHDIEWRLRLVSSALKAIPEQYNWRIFRYRVLSWMVVELLSNAPLYFSFCEQRLSEMRRLQGRSPTPEESSRLLGMLFYQMRISSSLGDCFFRREDHRLRWVDVATVNSLCVQDEFGEAITLQRRMLTVMILPTLILEATTKATNSYPVGRHRTIGTSRGYTLCDAIQSKSGKHNMKNPMWLFYSNLALSSLMSEFDTIRLMNPVVVGMAPMMREYVPDLINHGMNLMNDAASAGISNLKERSSSSGWNDYDSSDQDRPPSPRRRPQSRERRPPVRRTRSRSSSARRRPTKPPKFSNRYYESKPEMRRDMPESVQAKGGSNEEEANAAPSRVGLAERGKSVYQQGQRMVLTDSRPMVVIRGARTQTQRESSEDSDSDGVYYRRRRPEGNNRPQI